MRWESVAFLPRTTSLSAHEAPSAETAIISYATTYTGTLAVSGLTADLLMSMVTIRSRRRSSVKTPAYQMHARAMREEKRGGRIHMVWYGMVWYGMVGVNEPVAHFVIVFVFRKRYSNKHTGERR